MNAPVPSAQAAEAERSRLALKRPDLLREQACVAGDWISGDSVIEVVNPATGRLLGTIPDLGGQAADAAVKAAVSVQKDWAKRTARDRAVVLRRWFELMMANVEDLARLMTAEQGKSLAESKGEVAYAASFFEWFSEEGRRAYGDVIPPHQADRRLVVNRAPVGVVSAITPWNFPAAMITRKVAPALAAGCSVVLKPSELTPFSALALAVLGEEAGVPKGLFSVVTGKPQGIGEVFTGDPRIAKFTFTGSTAVGKKLAARCMDTVKRVSLELGGNAPFVVLNDADVDAAVEGALISKFRNTGQTCVCANRFLVEKGVYDAFAEKLTARAKALVVGDGLEGKTDQGPLINKAAVEKVERHIEDALKHGATITTGGKPSALGHDFFEPTVLEGVTIDTLLNHEETFGPVAGLIRVNDVDEAVRIANDTRAGLAAYLYTRDVAKAWKVSEALEYGMTGINTGLVSTEVAPFGGVKESGLGREGSRYGLDEYLDMKLAVFAV